MTDVYIEVNASFVAAILYILSYLETTLRLLIAKWVDNGGAIVASVEYIVGDTHIVEYTYVTGIRIVYTFSDPKLRHVRCYDGDDIVYTGTTYKGIPKEVVKVIHAKKFMDKGGDFTLEVWTTGCVIHRCGFFEQVYNPFDGSIDQYVN